LQLFGKWSYTTVSRIGFQECLNTYRLFTLSTAHRTTVLTLAPKELLHLVLDDALVIAERTFLQVLKTGSFDVLALLHAMIQFKKLWCKESLQLGL
jgi:hypothetical protein